METLGGSEELHYHETSIVPTDECETIYRETNNTQYEVRNENICTENVEGFSFSYGDQGNPLVANNILYGIASWNYGPKKYPNIYTKVNSYLPWIKENLN